MSRVAQRRGRVVKTPLTPEFLNELCHALRGPLGAIGTWVPVLRSERTDGETRLRALTAITSDVRTLGALIDQVSALTEALSSPSNVTFVPIDLVPFVRSACAAVSENGFESVLRTDEVSLVAIADPVRLRQIVELFASGCPDPTHRSRPLSIARRGQTAELSVETSGTPGTLNATLARALTEVQAGAFEESSEGGTTRLRVLLPLAP